MALVIQDRPHHQTEDCHVARFGSVSLCACSHPRQVHPKKAGIAGATITICRGGLRRLVSTFEIWLGILQGVRTTATVTAYGLVFAVPFALVFGIAQFLTTGLTRFLVTALIEFWRSSAVVVLLFVFYYVLPVVGVTLSALTVSALVLGLNAGGYASQAVRAGLQSLPAGQREAGMALGLSRAQILLLVELPQALVAMSPTFVNTLMQLVKATALVSLVTLTDMTFRAKEIAQTQNNPVAIYSALLLAFFVVCYPITLAGRWLEARVNVEKGPSRGI
ncbi:MULTISPECIES: amino acid ABC transporter permease [unclassified Mesorhizobium]|uniref:amino acid ABC transporter permease n=1 Tax=unclassified Mesorhizobium TaxID=325217 RepID=UPI001FD8BBD6|nr:MULTISPECIES: amino acid ABC transporter permease [unclassified Mesorhizobium]